MSKTVTAKALIAAGLSRSFAHHVMAGSRTPAIPLAIWLFDRHGLTVPPLVGKSRRELALLRSMYPPEAPASIRDRLASANDTTTQDRAA